MIPAIFRSTMIRQTSRVCFRRVVVAKCVVATPRLVSTIRPSTIYSGFRELPLSANFRSFSSSADALSDLLAREHAEEMENLTTTIPQALKDLKDQLQVDWKIVDSGSSVTKLYKTVGGLKVQISFHCQDTTERMEDEEVDASAEDEYEPADDYEEPAPTVRFTVTATKAGKSLVMICVSEDSVANIQSAAITDTDVETIHSTGIDPSSYQGPEFIELAEDLQNAFHSFLQDEVGVDNDVASFITMYTDYKEQCQYVKFLEDTKIILS